MSQYRTYQNRIYYLLSFGIPKICSNSVSSFVFISCLTISAAVKADEGTSDPDFDYLPPDDVGIFGQFTDFVADYFRSPSHAGSYIAAKRILYKHIKDRQTIYCGCNTNLAERTFDRASCGYTPRNDNVRAKRLEAEHILPAFWIAKFHTGESCWIADESCGGARECCLENDARFKKAHNDLVNLAPSIGELNADRSNFIYKLIDGEVQRYGNCDFEVDRSAKTSEPKNDIRGDIARVYFYMRDTYSLQYPADLTARLNAWHEADRISDDEKSRNTRIQEIQGTSNPRLQE